MIDLGCMIVMMAKAVAMVVTMAMRMDVIVS